MQDEPERGYGFSRKMSLKGVGIGMLGIDHQHGRYRSGEPGADPGVFGGVRGGTIRGGAACGGVLVGGAEAGAARVREPGPRRQGRGAAVCGADDGIEPRAGDAADHGASENRPGEGGRVSAHEVRHALHGRRRGVAGLRRPGARESEWPGDQADFGARILRLQPGRLRAAVVDFGGADLSVPQLGRLSPAQHDVSADAADGDSHWRTAQAAAARRRVDRQDREIKSDRIPDGDKLHNVQAELATHVASRELAIPPSPELAALTVELKQVNESLWQIEDHLREAERQKDFGAAFVELARSVYKTNDRRWAVKRQINELL